MCLIFSLLPLVKCVHHVQARMHIRAREREKRGLREESIFKVREGEHSSSVVRTQCFISHSRCVDYLFNWIFVWARQRQRTIVVTVERRMIEQGKGRGRAEGRRWVSIIFGACCWKHKPNYHRDRAKTCVRHVHTHTRVYRHTSICLLWTSSFAIWAHYRILAVSVCEFGEDVRIILCPSGPSYLLEAIYQLKAVLRNNAQSKRSGMSFVCHL